MHGNKNVFFTNVWCQTKVKLKKKIMYQTFKTCTIGFRLIAFFTESTGNSTTFQLINRKVLRFCHSQTIQRCPDQSDLSFWIRLELLMVHWFNALRQASSAAVVRPLLIPCTFSLLACGQSWSVFGSVTSPVTDSCRWLWSLMPFRCQCCPCFTAVCSGDVLGGSPGHVVNS